ncbi:MAG: phosphorylase [Bacteroidetes bacterium]|nr:MAG: phosphorylase [Bacteroidota bacterium]
MIQESELILNGDGSVYHLKLQPEMLADTIILVGDPGRVDTVSSFFDTITYKVQNRELKTHTGVYNHMPISVMSTGMGTDNLDIVINEIDALANIDLKKREIKSEKKSLRIVRLGTSGALQADIPVETFVAADWALGIDGLMNYYQDLDRIMDKEMTRAFISQTQWPEALSKPYFIPCSDSISSQLDTSYYHGITVTAPGFYGPQGRILRMPLAYPDLNERLETFVYNQRTISNFEMETSGLYGLGKSLGHEVLTVCVVIANRVRKEYCKDYKPAVNRLIGSMLDILSASK